MAHKAAAFMYLHTDQNQFSHYKGLDVVIINLLILIFYKLMNLITQVGQHVSMNE